MNMSTCFKTRLDGGSGQRNLEVLGDADDALEGFQPHAPLVVLGGVLQVGPEYRDDLDADLEDEVDGGLDHAVAR